MSSEIGIEPMQSTAAEKSSTNSPHSRWFVGVSCLSLVVGSVASTLFSKFYFTHGGSSIWLSTVIQNVGFSLLLPIIFLVPSTAHRRAFSGITPTMFCFSFGVGLVMGAATWLTSWGINSLPMSTTYLLLSSEVVFSRILNVLIVRERLTFHNINTVVFLIVSYVFLVLAESHDRVAGVSEGSYLVGFFFAMGASLLPVLYLPIVEGIQRRLTSYVMLVEIQVKIISSDNLLS